MEDMRLKSWAKLDYKNPTELVARLRPIQRAGAASALPRKVKALDTNKLRNAREIAEAAWFTYGLKRALNLPSLEFAMSEEQDYDCVARRLEDDSVHYTPIQLKRWVSGRRSLEEEIAKLGKYVTSRDLVVAVHLRRPGRIDLRKVQVPRLPIAQLWFYGCISADFGRWFLYGNALASPKLFEYEQTNA